MSLINNEINQYWVHFQAGKTGSNIIYPRVIVKCYHDDSFLLQINFYPDKNTLPVNYYDSVSDLVYLRYHMYMYAHTIDLLRNEKPIYYSFSKKSNLGFLHTGKEPVGEGEIETNQ